MQRAEIKVAEASAAARGRGRQRLTIALLLAVFVAPIVVAWWFAVVHPIGDRDGLLNHGRFLEPPIDINSSGVAEPLLAVGLRPGEWAMIYLGAGPCAQSCVQAVDKLHAVRNVLGQAATRVQVHAVVGSARMASAPSPTPIVAPALGAFIATQALARDAEFPDEAIVFLDWRDQIMLYFGTAAPPADIKGDIKRLLRASKIR